jgi:hypothetical protein
VYKKSLLYILKISCNVCVILRVYKFVFHVAISAELVLDAHK